MLVAALSKKDYHDTTDPAVNTDQNRGAADSIQQPLDLTCFGVKSAHLGHRGGGASQ